MLKSRRHSNWRSSPAHLLLLSKFLSARPAETYADSKGWLDALGEPVQRAIGRFLADGVLIPAGLGHRLDHCFTVTELRHLLRERGLRVSGSKADIIARLIDADPLGMEKAVAHLALLQCSEEGQRLSRQYLEAEKDKKDATFQQTLAMLQQGKCRSASLAMAAYEAGQVFQRGIGIDWQNYDPDDDIAMLERIMKGRTPKILKGIDSKDLAQLRLAAGMMHLWSLADADAANLLPDGFGTGIALGAPTSIRMLLTYHLQQAQLQQYRQMVRSGLCKTVSIRTCNDDSVCPACRAMAQRHYSLADVPELPHEKCTSEQGCRCWMVADIL